MKLHWQVNIKNVVAGRAIAEEVQKTVVSQKELAGFHPGPRCLRLHQNQVSVMSEQLTALKEMAPFADIISKAEDLYMPSAPPMSPFNDVLFHLLGVSSMLVRGRLTRQSAPRFWRSAPLSA